MLAFFYNFVFILASGGAESSGGWWSAFREFWDHYLNYPGFEFWKFLNLAIFIGFLVYVAKKPLGEAFKAKREAIRAELIKAEEEKKAALAKLTATEARLASLDAEKQAVLKKAKEESEAEKRRLAEQTESDIDKLRKQAESELSRLTQQTRNELKRFSANESIRLAEAKLRSKIDSNADADLVRSGIHAIGGLS